MEKYQVKNNKENIEQTAVSIDTASLYSQEV